jgi:steroid delta-isomerase-like uncharacterized protein
MPAPDRAHIQAANAATYAAWNAHDPDAVAALFAEHAEMIDTGNPEPIRGREAIRARAAGLLAAFADFHLERVELLIDPPCNADRWLVTAVHTGDFLGLGATGNAIRVAGCTFSHFDEHGLVDHDVNFWDVPSLMAQLAPAA